MDTQPPLYPRSDVVCYPIGAEAVLYRPDTEAFYNIGALERLAWSRCDGATTPAQVVDAAAGDAEDDIRTGLLEFLARLGRGGFLVGEPEPHHGLAPALAAEAGFESHVDMFETYFAVADVLEQSAMPQETFVHLGCGVGALIHVCGERLPGSRWIGVEPDAAQLKRATELLQGRDAELVHGSPEDWEVADDDDRTVVIRNDQLVDLPYERAQALMQRLQRASRIVVYTDVRDWLTIRELADKLGLELEERYANDRAAVVY